MDEGGEQCGLESEAQAVDPSGFVREVVEWGGGGGVGAGGGDGGEGDGWKILEGRFLLVWAMTVSHAATGMLWCHLRKGWDRDSCSWERRQRGGHRLQCTSVRLGGALKEFFRLVSVQHPSR